MPVDSSSVFSCQAPPVACAGGRVRIARLARWSLFLRIRWERVDAGASARRLFCRGHIVYFLRIHKLAIVPPPCSSLIAHPLGTFVPEEGGGLIIFAVRISGARSLPFLSFCCGLVYVFASFCRLRSARKKTSSDRRVAVCRVLIGLLHVAQISRTLAGGRVSFILNFYFVAGIWPG